MHESILCLTRCRGDGQALGDMLQAQSVRWQIYIQGNRVEARSPFTTQHPTGTLQQAGIPAGRITALARSLSVGK